MASTPSLWRDLSQANSRDGGAAQTNSDIVALADGGYLVVWEDHTFAGDIDMWGQRYDAAGSKLGDVSVEVVAEFADDADAESRSCRTATCVIAFDDDYGDHVDTWVDRFDREPEAPSRIQRRRANILPGLGRAVRAGISTDQKIAALANGQYVVSYTYNCAERQRPRRLRADHECRRQQGRAWWRSTPTAINADQSELATLSQRQFRHRLPA